MDAPRLIPASNHLRPAIPPPTANRGPFTTIHLSDYLGKRASGRMLSCFTDSPILDLWSRANGHQANVVPPISLPIPQDVGIPAPGVLNVNTELAAPAGHIAPTGRESSGRKVAVSVRSRRAYDVDRLTVRGQCRNCHESRKTCDEGRPCGRCVGRGEGASCVYVPRRRAKATHRRAHSTRNNHSVDAAMLGEGRFLLDICHSRLIGCLDLSSSIAMPIPNASVSSSQRVIG